MFYQGFRCARVEDISCAGSRENVVTTLHGMEQQFTLKLPVLPAQEDYNPASLQWTRHTRYALNIRTKSADSYKGTGLVFLGTPTKDTPPALLPLGEVW